MGAEVDLFYMDGETCRVDMDHKVSVLLIGALMFAIRL